MFESDRSIQPSKQAPFHILETYHEVLEEPAGVITFTVEDGVVTLDGRVPSLSHKRLAGVLVWWVPGSRDVINGLEVSPIQEDNDDEVTDAIRLVLEKDPFINAGQIQLRIRRFPRRRSCTAEANSFLATQMVGRQDIITAD